MGVCDLWAAFPLRWLLVRIWDGFGMMGEETMTCPRPLYWYIAAFTLCLSVGSFEYVLASHCLSCKHCLRVANSETSTCPAILSCDNQDVTSIRPALNDW